MSSATETQALLERLASTRLNTGIRAMAGEQGKNPELAAHLWKHAVVGKQAAARNRSARCFSR